MKKPRQKIFQSSISDIRASCGGMLVELLLSVALVAVAMPFLFQYQENAIHRAENIVITKQMTQVQGVLERYIVDNREKLMRTIGRNISRVDISELEPYGLPDDVLKSADKYHLRILKSSESGGGATLQGVIVMSADGITPLRTREIVSMGGGTMGFIDGNRAYGSFGAWRANVADFGVSTDNGIVGQTSVNRDNALYLWRVPTGDVDDATMGASLNLAGHDIENIGFLNTASANFDEVLSATEISTENLIFQNRTTLDKDYTTETSTVSGALSSDSRTMQINGTLTVQDLGKFSSFTTTDLWVTNLRLSGLSVSSDSAIPTIKVNDSINMTSGRITAMNVTVGFSGSITPRLVVSNRIQDSINSNYYWDAEKQTAHFLDATFAELNRMAPLALVATGGRATSTESYTAFSAVVANKNATVSEYLNAISEIGQRVRAKYRQLNLE